MKNIDVRFNSTEIALLKGFTNKKFIKFKSETLKFVPVFQQLIGFYIDDKIYKLSNYVEAQDYYGDIEDVGVFHLKEIDEEDLNKDFGDVKTDITNISERINKIYLIQEKQELHESSGVNYVVDLTRAIVFQLDTRQIAFVKDWCFGEGIEVQRGTNVLNKIMNDYEREDHEVGTEEEESVLKIERYLEEIM